MDKKAKALILRAVDTIESLIEKVENDYTSGEGELPEDVAERLMEDRELVAELLALVIKPV